MSGVGHECPRCGEPEILREGDYEWCDNCDYSDGTYTIDCPDCGEGWEYDPTTPFGLDRAKVDAAMHYDDKHDGPIPDDAEFGYDQCPECLAIQGMNGTVSCSECGHIPEEHRLIADGGTSPGDTKQEPGETYQCQHCGGESFRLVVGYDGEPAGCRCQLCETAYIFDPGNIELDDTEDTDTNRGGER